MSTILDCPACEAGDHEHHDPSVRGTFPGRIGGYVCGCKGDCAERAKKRWERFWGNSRIIDASKPVES